MFYELAVEKHLVSAIDMATSAGALMTFPAKERYLTGKTAQTGSIGVVAEHVDNRLWYKEFWGEIRTSVAKGDLKDAGTDTRGYDSKAKLVFEESVGKLHSIFVEAAARGLNKSFEEIDAQQSRVYIGQDGIDAGYAQGFMTLKELIEKYNTMTFTTPGRPAFSNIQTEENSMDIKTLEAEHPDVYQAVLDRGKDEGLKASNETAKHEGEAAGVLKERKRIQDIEALGLPDDFAAQAKQADWSAEFTAAKYLKAEAEKREKIATNMETDLEKPLETDAPEMPADPEGKAEAKTPEEEFKASAELQKEFGGSFERYQAFLKADAEGKVKIYNQGGK
jgi:hypothetical protein